VRGEGPALTNAIQDLRRNDGIRVRECGVPVRSEVSDPLGKEVITEKEPKGVLVPPRAADVPVEMRGKSAMDKPHVKDHNAVGATVIAVSLCGGVGGTDNRPFGDRKIGGKAAGSI